MHTSQGSSPFVIPTAITDQVAATMARARVRFGHDAFRMEDEGGEQDGGTGEQTGSGAGEAGSNTAGQQGEQKTTPEKVDDLPEWAQKLIKTTRGEAAENRSKATAAEKKLTEQLDGIAKALGLKDDEQVDPETLKKELGDTRSQARQSAIELAVYRTATKNQGDPDALLDSRGFLAKLTDLDPTSKDFTSKVETAIKDAVKDNPKLKATQAGGSSSADHTGGSGEGTKRTPKSLTDAVGGHYGT